MTALLKKLRGKLRMPSISTPPGLRYIYVHESRVVLVDMMLQLFGALGLSQHSGPSYRKFGVALLHPNYVEGTEST